MELNLNNKVVIITGGTSGIGEAISREFSKEGAITILVGRNQEKGEQLENEFKDAGKETLFLRGDLTDIDFCRQIIDKTVDKYGRIDVLVNNAGVNDGVGLDNDPEEFIYSLKKNLVHYFVMTHYAKSYLIENKGNIVNIGSKVANTGQGNTSGYAASKGGIQGLTREWAVTFRNDEVRVNEVIPAETWTPLYEKWIKSLPDSDKKLKEISSKIPLGERFTTSEEIANMVLFLASDKASHITGQHIYVDGGYTHLDRAIT